MGSTGNADVPADWRLHKDPRGFELRLPPGWAVETKDELLITAGSPSTGEFVAISPFIAPAGTDPQECLQKAPGTFPSLFPQGRIQTVRPGTRQGEAAASLSFDGNRRATLLCSLDGRAGMLYAIAAPAPTFELRRPDLVRVLDSFSFTGAGGGRSSETALSYKKFRDPKEGAFTVEVPDGWQVSGGAVRRAAVEVYPRLEVRSPDGKVRAFVGGDDLRTHAIPNRMLTFSGFPEGSEYSPGYGVTFVVRPVASGSQYAQEHASQRLGCQGYTRTGGGQRPDLARQLGSIYEQRGFIDVDLDVGEATFRCNTRPRTAMCSAGPWPPRRRAWASGRCNTSTGTGPSPSPRSWPGPSYSASSPPSGSTRSG